jgi:hypothetical protein
VPSVGGLRVQLKIRASTCGVSTRAFDPRWRPRNPAMPSASYRAFQVAIVCDVQSTRSQIVEYE